MIISMNMSSSPNKESPKSPKDPTMSDRWELKGKWGQNHGIMLQKKSLTNITGHGLLYANRQISEEMRLILSCNGTTGKLDCMALHLQMWATWTSLPPSLEYLRGVEVDFRVFNYARAHWRGGDGPGITAQHLLRLIGGFFECGPRFSGKPLNRELRLANITVNLVRVPCNLAIECDNDHKYRHWNNDSREDLYFGLADCLDKLQRSGLLFGRLQMLKLRCEGKADMEWEITDEGDTTKTAKEWAAYGWAPGLQFRN